MSSRTTDLVFRQQARHLAEALDAHKDGVWYARVDLQHGLTFGWLASEDEWDQHLDDDHFILVVGSDGMLVTVQDQYHVHKVVREEDEEQS